MTCQYAVNVRAPGPAVARRPCGCGRRDRRWRDGRAGRSRPRPEILDATVGRVIAADYLINQEVLKVKEGELDQGGATLAKKEIWTNLLIFVFFVWLLYRLGKSLLSVTWNPLFAIITVLVALVIIWALEGAYVLFGLKTGFIPFTGFVNMVRYGILQGAFFA